MMTLKFTISHDVKHEICRVDIKHKVWQTLIADWTRLVGVVA